MNAAIDNEILDLLIEKKDQEKGFRLLTKTYGSVLYNQIARMLNEKQDVEDVMQNVLLKVMRGIQSFKGNSSLYSWLFRIAHNESINQLNKRKQYYKRNNAIHSLEVNESQSHEMPDSQQILNVLNEAVAALPEKQRLVFELRYFNEKTYKEMSSMLKTSEGALKASYHHAVKKIENHIAKVSLHSYET